MGAQAVFDSWPMAALGAAVALLAAAIVTRIVLGAAQRLTRHHSALSTVVKCTEEPARLVLSALALQAIWQASADTLQFMGGVRHLTLVVLIGALTWLLIRLLRAAGNIISAMYPVHAGDNLRARRIQTQARVLSRTLMVFVLLFGLAAALMTFPSVRQVGMGLLASAGVAGLVVGFAAKPLLGNLLAGLQIAITQPIRLDDMVIVEGESGRIEEITGSYVVVALWDERRLVVPLQWFIEHPFQNWTRTSSQITGVVTFWVDYGFPVDALRKELAAICQGAQEWDGRVCTAQVTEATERAMQIRILVSSASAGLNWDLRCMVRERMIAFLVREYPRYVPLLRPDAVLPALAVSAIQSGLHDANAQAPR